MTAIPLASCADEAIGGLASATGSRAIAELDGATLLGERAMLAGLAIAGRTSAGGGCRLFDARDDVIALNLSRPTDRELLPALFETNDLDPRDDVTIAEAIAQCEAEPLLNRGRLLGLAIAAMHEVIPSSPHPCAELVSCPPVARDRSRQPRVLDLSALWAGPLAAHLLWLAGAHVVKVESKSRPDAMRDGDAPLFGLLNQGKASVVLDFGDPDDRRALLDLIAASDIVIEAARPRALAQLGIDVPQLVRAQPGLIWMTITAHGAEGEAANWVGFGDDCGVAGGLSAALHAASGRAAFVGDAIADPLSGIGAAKSAWDAWSSGRAGRFGLAMSHVAASCLEAARASDPERLDADLRAWAASAGKPFPEVRRRAAGPLHAFGADTRSALARVA